MAPKGWGQNLDRPSDYRFFLFRFNPPRIEQAGSREKEGQAVLKIIEEVLQSLSFSAGFYGAWLWFKASMVEVKPGSGINSGLEDMQRNAWIDALLRSARESASLNKQAALVTGVAVGAQGVLALLDRLTLSG